MVLAAASIRGGDAGDDLSAKLAPNPPFADLLNAAKTKGIPTDRVDGLSDGGAINPGDSVTALVTLREKGGLRTQWLIYLQAEEPNAKERSAKPPRPQILFSSMGNRFEFISTPAYATVRTLGPFVDSASSHKPAEPRDQTSRIRLDKDYLGLGLDRAAAAAFRLKRIKTKELLSFKSAPYSDAEVARCRKLLPELQLTADEERSLCGAVPALFTYFGIVQQTQGLNDILLKLVEMPSVWSIMRHGGVGDVSLRFERAKIVKADLAQWGMSSNTVGYHFPMVMSLDGHPALELTFAVAPPRPPLLTCAGIVGLLAERPNDKDTYLTLRVISARRHD
jgi:hypothetical protein